MNIKDKKTLINYSKALQRMIVTEHCDLKYIASLTSEMHYIDAIIETTKFSKFKFSEPSEVEVKDGKIALPKGSNYLHYKYGIMVEDYGFRLYSDSYGACYRFENKLVLQGKKAALIEDGKYKIEKINQNFKLTRV